MSDSKDAINDARVRIKKIAASMLVRKENLEKELAKLVKQRDDARAGPGEGSDELEAELSALVSAKEEELAIAESDLKGALSEMDDLGKLEGQAERASFRALIDSARGGGDPVIQSHTERTLDHVRDHIANLDAQAKLDPAPAARPRGLPLSEDEARAKLEALKAAKRAKTEGPPKPRTDPTDVDGGDAPAEPAPKTKPKRTL